MNSGINVRKTVKKRDRNRLLSGLAYLCGLPLLIAFVFVGSIPFMNGAAFAKTQYYGVIICAALWVVMTLVQIIMALVTKNNTARAVVVILVCVAIMVGGALFFDLSWAKNKVDEAREGYIRDVHGLKADDKVEWVDENGNVTEYAKELEGTLLRKYKLQTTYYVPWTNISGLTDEFNEMIADFMRVYNIDYASSVKGDVNTDGSEYGESKIKRTDKEGKEYTEYWFGEEGAVYKENGLYADGYIFSVPVATEILITYYQTQADYKAQGKDADEELAKALVKAANSSAYKEYQKTAEYKAMAKTQKRYMLTPERLNVLLGALGKGLLAMDLIDGQIQPMYTDISSLVWAISAAMLPKSIDIEDYVTKAEASSLTLDKVIGIVQRFGLDFTEKQILALLEGFSNYEVSNVKPVMYFIEDETLRSYAYAEYFGKTHGGNIGSKLIPDKTVTTTTTKVVDHFSKKDWTDMKPADKAVYEGSIKLDDGSYDAVKEVTETTVTYGKIGCITMNDSGLSAEENAFSLEKLYMVRATTKFIPCLYPLFAARRYVYVFAGIDALMYAIFYYAQMKVKLIGIKLERMSQIAGGEY